MKTRKDKLPENLRKTVDALEGGGGTAQVLAVKLECSKPTVYARLAALRKHGYTFQEKPIRDASRGPLAREFSIRRRAKTETHASA